MDFITENFLHVATLVGTIYILAALISHFFPPKKINHLYGYRTVNSMKNQEQWDFAQKYSTIQMVKAGFLMVILSAIGFVIPLSENLNLILGLSLAILITFLMIFSVEKAIKKKFPDVK